MMRFADALRLALIVAFAATAVWAQGPDDPETIPQAMEDLGYAELLNAAQLTAEQLGALLETQILWEAETALAPELATDLAEVRDGVLKGMSMGEAFNALGERQQAVHQAQARLEQTLQRLAGELGDSLTDEQGIALARFMSPARALDGVVNTLAQTRAMPEEQWEQFKASMVEALSRLASQIQPGAANVRETVGALLDAARTMEDADFDARRPKLADEWLQALAPSLLQQLQSKEARAQRLAQTSRHLITYPRGAGLVEAKLAALQPPE